MEWIDCNDELPEKGEIVLICDDYLNYFVCRFLGYSEENERCEFGETIEDYYTWAVDRVRYWCRIPAPYINEGDLDES